MEKDGVGKEKGKKEGKRKVGGNGRLSSSKKNP